MMDIHHTEKIDLRNKAVTIIGLGESGKAAAGLANYVGARVFVSDTGSNRKISEYAMDLMHQLIACETGLHSNRIYEADLWVISPGVPKNADIIKVAKEKNIPIVSEIEFASWFTESPIIAVTGSNGKTTTVNILAEMCQTDDHTSVLAGNVGMPFSEKTLDELMSPNPKTIYVLEISSFQMEFIQNFCPTIAVYTNISPDHLDRHGSLDEYITMKLNMVKNMSKSGHIVFNADDPQLAISFENHKMGLAPFSLLQSDVTFPLNSTKVYNSNGDSLVKIDEVALPGKHNLANMLAAATAAHLIGISDEHISHVLKKFKGVEHRLEQVTTIGNVLFINDSKATNLDSVIVALESFNQPIVLILGGQNKGADFRLLLPHIKSSHVRDVITYGEAGEEIMTAIGDAVRSVQVTDLRSAVVTAHEMAAPGDVVLLSPGCASFDQFMNFEERGQFFKTLISEIAVA